MEIDDPTGNNNDKDGDHNGPAPFFSMPLILKKILSNLNVTDLLSCTLVNKSWNYEARCILRDERMHVARIISNKPCESLKKFSSMIAGLNAVPYSGLSIKVGDYYSNPWGVTPHTIEQCLGSKDVKEFYAPFFNLMLIKYLEIDWYGQIAEGCPAVDLIRTIVTSTSTHLQVLELKLLPQGFEFFPFEEIVTRQIWLPGVKVLKFDEGCREEALPNDVDVSILSVLPNLEELHLEIYGYDQGYLPDDKLKCITNLAFCPNQVENFEFLERIVSSGAALQRLTVTSTPRLDVNTERSWKVLSNLLEKSKDSLKRLQMYLVVVVKVSVMGILPFSNLQRLDIDTHAIPVSSPNYQLLRRVNFTQLFPRLEEIVFNPTAPAPELPPEQVEELLKGDKKTEDLNSSLSYTGGLTLRSNLRIESVQSFGEIFPRITSFTGNTGRLSLTPYSLLWITWPHLEQLVLSEFGLLADEDERFLTPFVNLDAIFCGIHPEEAAELQTKDDNFLEAVQIVPIKPAITCLRNLRKLRLRTKISAPKVPVEIPELFLLSRVTGHLAFRRMPGLKVTVEEDDTALEYVPLFFQHLEPFATVTKKKFEF